MLSLALLGGLPRSGCGASALDAEGPQRKKRRRSRRAERVIFLRVSIRVKRGAGFWVAFGFRR